MPVLRALGVKTRRSLDIAWRRNARPVPQHRMVTLERRWLPTSLPCAPHCTMVKAALHKAINAGQPAHASVNDRDKDEV